MTEALDDAVRYLDRGGDVAILDGTNITRDRRKIISDKISSLKGYSILWIESSSLRGDDVSEQQFEELKNSPDFLDKVAIPHCCCNCYFYGTDLGACLSDTYVPTRRTITSAKWLYTGRATSPWRKRKAASSR